MEQHEEGGKKQITKEDLRNISQACRNVFHKANALLEEMFARERKSNQKS